MLTACPAGACLTVLRASHARPKRRVRSTRNSVMAPQPYFSRVPTTSASRERCGYGSDARLRSTNPAPFRFEARQIRQDGTPLFQNIRVHPWHLPRV